MRCPEAENKKLPREPTWSTDSTTEGPNLPKNSVWERNIPEKRGGHQPISETTTTPTTTSVPTTSVPTIRPLRPEIRRECLQEVKGIPTETQHLEHEGERTTEEELKVNDIHLINTNHNFFSGKTRLSLEKWETLTSNSEILNYIQGVSIIPDFTNLPKDKNQIKFSKEESFDLLSEIDKFIEKQIIQKVNPDPSQIISNVFLRFKSDDSFRVILNLSNLNDKLGKVHFKMDSLKTVLNIVKKNVWFGKIDLKDAYYSIPIAETSRKFFRFYFNQDLYEYQCLAQGFVDAPRIFTKVMKVPLSFLRSKGFINVGYLDDIFIQGDSFEECQTNIFTTIQLLDELGFTIHLTKSVVIPNQIMSFLGFSLNSINMTIQPTQKKSEDIISSCSQILNKKDTTIRDLSIIVGKLIAVEPGNKVAPVFYKRIENYKNKMLKLHKGRYDSYIKLSNEVIEDLQWWLININSFPKPIIDPPYSVDIFTDACKTGWGVEFYESSTGGIWDEAEMDLHINEQELKAIQLSLLSFCNDKENEHIHVFSDNTTAVACINRKGSSKEHLNSLTRQIWLWAIKNNNFLTASHIPGVNNVIADAESRKLTQGETEWKLNPTIFKKINDKLGPFEVDLFASRLNYQMIPFFSWNPDPLAKFINAFHINWQHIYGYCFPPFPVIGKVLQKVESEQATICLICPAWQSQVFFPKMLGLLIDFPILIPNRKNNLTHPSDTQKQHPLCLKLNLMACLISGKQSLHQKFMSELCTTYIGPGVKVPKNSTIPILRNGLNFALNGIMIPTRQL